jgi:hypothetical protein
MCSPLKVNGRVECIEIMKHEAQTEGKMSVKGDDEAGQILLFIPEDRGKICVV